MACAGNRKTSPIALLKQLRARALLKLLPCAIFELIGVAAILVSLIRLPASQVAARPASHRASSPPRPPAAPKYCARVLACVLAVCHVWRAGGAVVHRGPHGLL